MDEARQRVKSALSAFESVGIDTSPFIYHLEDDPLYTPFTEVLFEAVEGGKLRAVTSTITLMEMLVKPKREDDLKAVSDYKFVLRTFPNLKLRPIDEDVAQQASEARAKYGLRPPDALQVATAIVEGAEAFVTNDEGIKSVQEMEVIVMKEVLGLT